MKLLSAITAVCLWLVTVNAALLPLAQDVEGASELFPPERIEELEEPREWQKPDQIMEFLDIQEGYVVADIGTGAGYFALYLSDWVGETGLVYAEDIQQEMVDYTTEVIEDEEITNVEVVLGEPDDPGLPANSLDLALMANVYHQVENPVALLKSIARELKPDGRLIIIDWRSDRESDDGPPMLDRVPRDMVETDAEKAGYYLVRYHPFLRYHYFLIFKKRTE
ncbi:MAG: class I SAM-dependent methyltransferase [Candidatus Brocadiales bacterium]